MIELIAAGVAGFVLGAVIAAWVILREVQEGIDTGIEGMHADVPVPDMLNPCHGKTWCMHMYRTTDPGCTGCPGRGE